MNKKKFKEVGHIHYLKKSETESLLTEIFKNKVYHLHGIIYQPGDTKTHRKQTIFTSFFKAVPRCPKIIV